jgi:ankyrin repeat protein
MVRPNQVRVVRLFLATTVLFVLPAGCVAQQASAADDPDEVRRAQALTKQVQDKDPEVRRKAVESLRKMGPAARHAVRPLFEGWINTRARDAERSACFDAIVAIGKPAVPVLVEILRDPKHPHRASVSNLLNWISDKHGTGAIKEAVPALIEATSADRYTAYSAVSVLTRTGQEARDSVPAMEKALGASEEPYVKQQLATFIQKLTGGKSEPARQALVQFEKNQRLIEAAKGGKAEFVRQQLQAGAAVDARYVDLHAFLDPGMNDYTALNLAVLGGREEVVQILIAAKADVNQPCFAYGHQGQTNLYMAVIREKDGIVKLLVAAGAKGDAKQIRLTRELLAAACRGFEIREGEGYPLFPGVVGKLKNPPPAGKLLEVKPDKPIPPREADPENARAILDVLKRGADVNSADPAGYTALMYAANLGLVENVKVLLANGADATLKTESGSTALDLCQSRSSVARAERKQVAEILKAHLAKKAPQQ